MHLFIVGISVANIFLALWAYIFYKSERKWDRERNLLLYAIVFALLAIYFKVGS